MTEYLWEVWKNCRMVGYVKAYSEHSAMEKAGKEYGSNFFLLRTHWQNKQILESIDNG